MFKSLAIAAMLGVTGLNPVHHTAINAPVCQTVIIQENSGNGPNFPVEVCNSGGPALEELPLGHHWVFIIDGGPLPEKSTKTATIAISEVAQTILTWPGGRG